MATTDLIVITMAFAMIVACAVAITFALLRIGAALDVIADCLCATKDEARDAFRNRRE